jgi:hypothetical protein
MELPLATSKISGSGATNVKRFRSQETASDHVQQEGFTINLVVGIIV